MVAVNMKKLLTVLCLMTSLQWQQCFATTLTWTSPITISTPGVDASDPQIMIDTAGNVTAVWLESGVVSSATLPAGGSWSAETAISSTGASSLSAYVDSSGNAVAIWVREEFTASPKLQFNLFK
jgi:hypothetical protein